MLPTSPYELSAPEIAVDYHNPSPSYSSSSSCLKRWWINYLWPGMGLFGESYLLFSIGILTPIWKELYPNCFDEDVAAATCRPRLIQSLTYGVVVGVILGMIVIGYASNVIGRKTGSIVTASLMSLGSASLFALSALFTHDVDADDSDSAVPLFRGTVISLFVFGVGMLRIHTTLH